jgi:hypothetical protein
MERTPRTAAERKQLIDLGLLLSDTIKIVRRRMGQGRLHLRPFQHKCFHQRKCPDLAQSSSPRGPEDDSRHLGIAE